jgi:hypothetical protein
LDGGQLGALALDIGSHRWRETIQVPIQSGLENRVQHHAKNGHGKHCGDS